MKRLVMLIMTILLSAAVTVMQAQMTEKTKEKPKEVKKEMKAKRVPMKKLVGKDINPVSIENFKVDFGGIPASKWERYDYFDEAVFTKNGTQYRAFYNIDGKLVGTTTKVKFTDLPKNAQSEMQKQYKDYTIGPAIFFDDNEAVTSDMYLYGTQFEDRDNYFVELTKGSKRIVIQATPEGDIFYFTEF
jgi:hypothetical protein